MIWTHTLRTSSVMQCYTRRSTHCAIRAADGSKVRLTNIYLGLNHPRWIGCMQMSTRGLWLAVCKWVRTGVRNCGGINNLAAGDLAGSDSGTSYHCNSPAQSSDDTIDVSIPVIQLDESSTMNLQEQLKEIITADSFVENSSGSLPTPYWSELIKLSTKQLIINDDDNSNTTTTTATTTTTTTTNNNNDNNIIHNS